MGFVTFYIDSAERTCRTQVFASTATDTAFRIDNRDHYGLVLFAVFTTSSMAVTAVERNHLYSSDRTMSSTIPAIYSVGKRDAVLFHPYGVAYLYARFFGNGDGAYGSCRAHLRTLGTFGTAISAFVRHFGLHESHQITRWPQADMHNWHAVQCWAMFDALSEPGGVMGVIRLGIFLSSMTARPPSTFFS